MLKIKPRSTLGSIWQAVWLFIETLPVTLPVAVAAFGVVALAFLLNDSFTTSGVLAVGGVVALLTAGIVMGAYRKVKRPGGTYEKRIVDVLVIVLALFWIGFNVSFTSEHVFTDRDPATYIVAGAWLTEHESLRIQTPEAFQGIEGVALDSAGFASVPQGRDEVFAQGQHLLPALIGMGGRVFGDMSIFNVNIVLGAIALMAVYGFARHFVRPRWAVFAPVVLAVSMPMLYLSRDTYTEPLMMAFVFGALSTLWIAMASRGAGIWLVAGILAAAGVMARIDAYLVLMALLAAAVIWAAVTSRSAMGKSVFLLGTFLLGVVLVIAVGAMDLYVLSPQYLGSIRPLFVQQLVLLLVVVCGSLVALFGVRLFPQLLPWVHKISKDWRGPMVAILILLVALFMVVRPLWMETSSSGPNGIVTAIQVREGDPIETRNYAEQTTRWLSWYLGPIAVALGTAGLALAAGLAIRKKMYVPLLAVVVAVAGTALVYLMMPNITPDHPWAARRFLPVVLPGLAVMAVFLIDRLSQRYFDRERVVFRSGIGLVVGAFLVVAPLSVSWPFLEVRDTARLEQVNQVCRNLPADAAVIWTGNARLELTVPTQIFCDTPAITLSSHNKADVAERDIIRPIAQELRERGYTPIIGAYEYDMHFLPTRTDDRFGELYHVYEEYQRTLEEPPRKVEEIENIIILGEVEASGTVVPLREIR